LRIDPERPLKRVCGLKELHVNFQIHKKFGLEHKVVMIRGDCAKHLAELPDSCIDLTVTSPPYCMGKEYEKTKDLNEFVKAHEQILPEIVRVTKEGGSICWQVGYHVRSGVLTPLDFLVHSIMSKLENLLLRNRIIWTYGHGLHTSRRFSGRHEVILWYTKGPDYFFDLDSVRVPQKYPGKKHYKGPRKGAYSGNRLGKNPSDIWEIPNVKANHIEKTLHPCQFPVALAQRLIRALTPSQGRVLDPFSGAGSTGAAAILERRKFVGFEIESTYHDIALARFSDALRGQLRFRPLEKPIYEPDAGDPITIKPPGFQ
jgi:adenine-specific DNA-methyltransferase